MVTTGRGSPSDWTNVRNGRFGDADDAEGECLLLKSLFESICRPRPPRVRTGLERTHFTSSVLAILVFATLLSVGLLGSAAQAQGIWGNYSVEYEVELGRQAAQEIIDAYGPIISLSPQDTEVLATIFTGLLQHAERRREIDYSLWVLASDEINAFAVPGGYIFITFGLLKFIGDDLEAVANALGHEIAHIEKRHSMEALGKHSSLQFLLQMGSIAQQDDMQRVLDFSLGILTSGWSQEYEYEADFRGQHLAGLAGYDPMGMVRLLTRMQELELFESVYSRLFGSHPVKSERIQQATIRANTLRRTLRF